MAKISYDHPNYRDIEHEVRKRFTSDFNSIALDVVEKYYDNCLFEYIAMPDYNVICKEWLGSINDNIEEKYKQDQGTYNPDDRIPFQEWLEENYHNEITDYYDEQEHYPIWGTVFEAKDSFLSQKIADHIDELYEIGIGVIQSKDSLNSMLFIAGAGYDFYAEHWLPMYQLFGWIDEKLLGENNG